MDLIKIESIDKQTNTLLYSLPDGKVFERKFDNTSNMYKFWRSISLSYIVLEEDFNRLYNELNAQTTEELIELWEKQYGIPDSIFLADGTLEERRRDILAKISANGLSSRDDFIAFFDFLGYDVTIESGKGSFGFPWTFTHVFGGTSEQNRFIIIVSFGSPIPPNLDSLQAFLETLVPSNVQVIFTE